MAEKILIVDDAKFMRKVLADILKKGGYEVCGEAANGNEAVKLYKELKPDLVTMDIVMPDKNGIEALREILAFDPSAKVLVVSAMGQQPLVLEAIQAGAKDYIVKPFQPSRVLEAVERILKSK
jgi:two-component system chemotaxis response regulator CheY